MAEAFLVVAFGVRYFWFVDKSFGGGLNVIYRFAATEHLRLAHHDNLHDRLLVLLFHIFVLFFSLNDRDTFYIYLRIRRSSFLSLRIKEELFDDHLFAV